MNKASEVSRVVFAFVFITGAIVNLIMLNGLPELYAGFASDAVIPIYSQVWDNTIYPNLTIFIGLVVLLEVSIVILLCAKDKIVKTGFLIAAGFMLALVPFWWYGTSLINLALAIAFIWLARFSYPFGMQEFIVNVMNHPSEI